MTKFMNWDVCGFKRNTAAMLYREGINPLVSVFLVSRGIASLDDAFVMIGNTPGDIYDPFLLNDIDIAVERINKAIESNERIAVYGDYDVDGMTSCVVVSSWLRSKKADFEVYIPDRIKEGYCLNNSALDYLKSQGVNLIITVDCGITANKQAEYAKSLGLDLIITDHHECRAELPEAIAVIDPKRPDCIYPNKDLAGVGVAFKLICALEKDTCIEELINKYCDLAAVGTIADVMPIYGENRELIRRGLQVLNKTPRPGIYSLLEQAYPDRNLQLNGLCKICATTISYTLAPRLNAAGRMGQAYLSVKLLLADAGKDAGLFAKELCGLNSDRREIETVIYDDVIKMIPKTDTPEPIVIANKDWHQGVTGIVASKIAETYRVPTIIISIEDNGNNHGTCRSFGTFNLYQAISSCEDILLGYGGHEAAAGITISEENIDEFRRRIVKYYKTNYQPEHDHDLHIDFEVEKPELLSVENIEALIRLEPFGNNNPFPCLCIKNAVLSSLRSIGDDKHSRFKIEKSGISFDCIYFSMPLCDLGFGEGEFVDIAFEPQINEYRGRVSVQLNIIDIRSAI